MKKTIISLNEQKRKKKTILTQIHVDSSYCFL